MKTRERILLMLGLAVIGAAALGVLFLKTHRQLGKPGVRAEVVPGSPRMHLNFVTNVPGYDVRDVPFPELMTNGLPQDTSFRQCVYSNTEGPIQNFVVMMGSDRTSIHQPQYCLTGQGWTIDDSRSEITNVRLDRPRPLNLPVNKLIATLNFEHEGRPQRISGVFVYWFVADGAVTAHHSQFGLGVIKHMLKTGELQRWAYIAYFVACEPGQEERAFSRIQRLMNKTLPDFQLAWPAPIVTATVAR